MKIRRRPRRANDLHCDTRSTKGRPDAPGVAGRDGVVDAKRLPCFEADRALLLDNITPGRFMPGIGPGLLAFDSALIGLDPGAVRDDLQEDFPALMRLLRCYAPLTVETSRYRLVEARTQLDTYSDFDIAVTSVLTPSGPLLAGWFGVGLLQLSGLTSEGWPSFASTGR